MKSLKDIFNNLFNSKKGEHMSKNKMSKEQLESIREIVHGIDEGDQFMIIRSSLKEEGVQVLISIVGSVDVLSDSLMHAVKDKRSGMKEVFEATLSKLASRTFFDALSGGKDDESEPAVFSPSVKKDKEIIN